MTTTQRPARLREARGDRDVLAEVARQPEGPDAIVGRDELGEHVPRAVRRAVVDEDELVREAHRLERRGEPLVQRVQAGRAGVGRHDDADLDGRRHPWPLLYRRSSGER